MEDEERGYWGFLTPVTDVSRDLANSAIDLGDAVRKRIIRGYYDAKGKFHEVKNEDKPGKILRNAIGIAVFTPGVGIPSGVAYFIWRGGVYLFKPKEEMREEKREKESDLVRK